MAASILASGLYADPLNETSETSSPVAGVWYTLDLCWGWEASDAAATITTTLSIAGATIDTDYTAPFEHRESVSGRQKAEGGWTPNGDAIYLTPQEYAAGFWRVKFPTAGAYTISLSGVGSFGVTAVAAAAGPTVPTLTALSILPLNRPRSYVYEIAYTGTYPSGGLDLTEAVLGFETLFFAGVNDTADYRFWWSADKLRVFDSDGEVSGSLDFTTRGLFVGI